MNTDVTGNVLTCELCSAIIKTRTLEHGTLGQHDSGKQTLNPYMSNTSAQYSMDKQNVQWIFSCPLDQWHTGISNGL